MSNRPLHRLLLASALLLLTVGCDSKGARPTQRAVVPDLDTEVFQQDDLTLGMEFLHRINDPAPEEIQRLALYHLSQWLLRANREARDWKPAALLQYVPKSLAAIQPLQELDRAKLTPSDLAFLQGRIWQRDLGNWLKDRPLEEPWAAWIKQQESRLDETSSAQLALTLQSFDWTVRNIQLDALAQPETKAAGTASGDEAAASPPQRGVPGPGYQRYPHETMLYGHGDAYERARVFMEILRQQQIDSVLLAVDRANAPLRPWAVAVLIGSELFLFDTELGLPLPSADGRGVVTLAELVEAPELLEQLNVNEKQSYLVTAEDLKSLRPLISASPEELSKRMWLLDRQVTGPKHLELFVDADALAERVARSPQLAAARPALWRVPFECSLYELGRGLRLSRDREFALEYDRETLILRLPGTPLRRARQLQLQGEFETSEETLAKRREQRRISGGVTPEFDGGAVELLLQVRPEGRAIEDLAYSEYWQQAFGLQGQIPSDPAQRREFLDIIGARIQQVRDDATYWLGLVQYEKRDYQNAIHWLESVRDDSDSPWATGARYNLARCHEALGDRDQAIKLYRSDNSPQRHGNRLRAKWLEAREGAVPAEQ